MRGQLPGSPPPEKKGGKNSAESELLKELELLIDKSHKCPVCAKQFTSKIVPTKNAVSDGVEMDLRPRFKTVDAVKYRVVECPSCGYADFDRTFEEVTEKEVKLLKDKSLEIKKDAPSETSARSYEDAYRILKSALRCHLVRGSISSKRGYTAINAAWILRGWREKLRWDGYIVTESDAMNLDEERKLVKYALRNFKDAELNENFPISGMDDATFDYFMASLCFNQGDINDAGKYILRSLTNRSLKPTLRPMAEDLRDLIKDKRKEG